MEIYVKDTDPLDLYREFEMESIEFTGLIECIVVWVTLV